jgi:GntR family transcriptional regulator
MSSPAISPHQVVPLYHQIYVVLRERILEGQFNNRPLPSELDLAADFKVSRVTMRRALQALVDEGLVARGRGKGTFVQPQPALSEDAAKSDLSGLLENLLNLGQQMTVRVLDVQTIDAPMDIQRELRLKASVQVQKAIRVRSYKGEPLSYLTTFVPDFIAQHFGRKELAIKPMLALLEDSGIRIGTAQQTISAKVADAAVATHLQIQVGAPLLSVQRLIFDVHGQPVELLRGLYRPDRFEYRMELTRGGSEKASVWVSKDTAMEFQ